MTRVLFYVQHLLGVGHLKRAEILAAAMASAGLRVTGALGGQPLTDVFFAAAEVAQLPPAVIVGQDFSTLFDETGRPVDAAWRVRRSKALLDLYRRTEPDVVLLELFPFGRRQFRFELLPLLENLHADPRRPAVVCSVRDILVGSGKAGRDTEAIDLVHRFIDMVLVHGDPSLIPFEATFPRAAEISEKIRYTGYVTAPTAAPATTEGRGEVLVSAGGGAVGGPLLFAALEARASTPLASHVWRFLTGPNLPDDLYDRLLAATDERTVVERFRTDFPARLRGAALSISQAGYNTTMDLLQSDAPAVVIPYETPSETEQRLRADLLAARGILTVVPAAELTPTRLTQAVHAALSAKRPPGARLNTDGAATTARLVAGLAKRRADGLPSYS